MVGPTNAVTDADIQVERKSNETYRGRARGTSALTAAAAGALAAGLVVSPSEGLPELARTLGLVAIILLVVSTGTFVVASLVHAYSPQGNEQHWLAGFARPWRIAHHESSGVANQALAPRLDTAQRMSKRIRLFTDLGMWSAFVAVVSLILALFFITTSASTSVPVQITRTGGASLMVPGCGPIVGAIKGAVLQQDLHGDTASIRVAIDPSQCSIKARGPIDIYLERTSIAVISSSSSR